MWSTLFLTKIVKRSQSKPIKKQFFSAPHLRFLHPTALPNMRPVRNTKRCAKPSTGQQQWKKATAGALIVFLCGSLGQTANATDSTRYQFNIPPLKVEQALGQLAKQTGHQLLFSYDLVDTHQSTAVQGEHSINSALQQLLQSTPLTGDLTERGVIIITDPRAQNYSHKGRGNMNTSTNKRKSLLATMVGLMAAGGLSTAVVQENESARAQGILDEIVVTARMRAENILDVPITETVFNAQQIQDAGIEQARDFINLTPNMSIVEQAKGSNSFLTVRGISKVRTGESPIAVIVDGVQQSSSRQLTQGLFDVESIEVVKGPQGALYGRNATAGAVIISTKRPTDEMSGSLRFEGGRGNSYLTEGVIRGPASENVGYSLAFRYEDSDGIYNNSFLNEKVDFNEEFTGRGRLIWTPRDNVEVDFKVNIARQEGGALNYTYQRALVDSTGHFLIDANSFSSFDFTAGDANQVDRTFNSNNLGTNERNIDEYSVSITLDYDWGTLRSVTAYNDVFREQKGDQFPYTADRVTVFGGGGQSNNTSVESWSEEIRLTSRDDQTFRWQVGAYYLSTDSTVASTGSLDTGQGILSVGTSFLTDPRNPTQTYLGSADDNKAWALFGNIAYDVSDKLELGIAARYDRDEREQHVSPFNTAGVPNAINNAEFSAFQPKFSLRYKLQENVSVFASWGKGFRSGQFNENGVADIAAGLGIGGVSDIVPEEVTTTSEIGFKGVYADGRVRVNAAIFDTELENGQFLLFVGALNASIVTAIDDVDIRGAELDFSLEVAEGFDIVAAYGITDTEINEYSLDPSSEGNKLFNVPDFTFNLGGQYRGSIVDQIDGFIRVDYERRGSQFGTPANLSERDPITLVNLRLGIEDTDDSWSLVAEVTNATYEEYNSQYVNGFAYAAAPRIWSLGYTYNF